MGRMARFIGTLQHGLAVLRGLMSLAMLGLLLVAGYWVYQTWNERTRYERYLHNLLGEQRIAEICVLSQERPPDQPVRTTLRFQEFRQNGTALAPLGIKLPGEEIYVDALVTVFDGDSVKNGRAKSLYLFRRIFTEVLAPQDGYPLYRDDESGDGIPSPYVHRGMERFVQQHVWQDLWRLIEDSAYAETQHVRTKFGQAVYARMQPGLCYTLTIQHQGGLLLGEGAPAR
jgi:hypothetical protein